MADFLDKIKGGFDKSVAAVSTGSKNVIEKTKINSTIKSLEDDITKLQTFIGKRVYEYFKASDLALSKGEVEQWCADIDCRLAQISEQKSRLAHLDAEMDMVMGKSSVTNGLCKCGHANSAGAKFCAKCGSKL